VKAWDSVGSDRWKPERQGPATTADAAVPDDAAGCGGVVARASPSGASRSGLGVAGLGGKAKSNEGAKN